MGLRNYICLLPHEASGHGDEEEEEEEEQQQQQPGTSYNNLGAQRERKVGRVNCSSGGAQMLACFRAGAINLIVHPAMVMGGQRQQVQPVTSLPRTAFLDGHESGDDPTSPVVSCIGQVRKDKPAKTTAPKGGEIWSLKAKREKESTPSSPRPFKWKQILGTAGGTVNPSQQPRTDETEFHIDLNRFGSSMQDQAVTPGFGQMNNRARTFPASTFMAESEVATLESPPARQEVLLWKRRNGACKPVTLELKRRVLKSDFR